MPFRCGCQYREDLHEELHAELNALLSEFLKDQQMPRITGRQLLRLIELIDMHELQEDEEVLNNMERLLPAISKASLRRLAYELHIRDIEQSGALYLPRAILELVEERRLCYEPDNLRLKKQIAEGLREHDNIGKNRGPQLEQARVRENIDVWLERIDTVCESVSNVECPAQGEEKEQEDGKGKRENGLQQSKLGEWLPFRLP